MRSPRRCNRGEDEVNVDGELCDLGELAVIGDGKFSDRGEDKVNVDGTFSNGGEDKVNVDGKFINAGELGVRSDGKLSGIGELSVNADGGFSEGREDGVTRDGKRCDALGSEKSALRGRSNRRRHGDIGTSMLSMRTLLLSDPFLPIETRQRIALGDIAAREDLLRLGANDCEAAELLDEVRATWPCEQA